MWRWTGFKRQRNGRIRRDSQNRLKCLTGTCTSRSDLFLVFENSLDTWYIIYNLQMTRWQSEKANKLVSYFTDKHKRQVPEDLAVQWTTFRAWVRTVTSAQHGTGFNNDHTMYNMTALLLEMRPKVPKKPKWPVTSELEMKKKTKLYYKHNTGHALIAHGA